MKNKWKKIMITVMMISMVFSLIGCGAKEKDEKGDQAKDAKKTQLIMGTNAEFPPFEYRTEEGIEGFDIDIAKTIAEKEGLELKIEDMAFDGLIAALQSGKVDFVVAGMTANEERAKSVDFSIPYFEASQMIVVTEDNADIKSKEDLKGKKLGVQLGTTGDVEATNVEGAEVSRFNAAAMAIMDLLNNKVDAVILDAEPAKNFVNAQEGLKILDEPLTEEVYSIAVPKGDKELLDKINAVIKELKDNGEYDKLYNQYFDEKEEK